MNSQLIGSQLKSKIHFVNSTPLLLDSLLMIISVEEAGDLLKKIKRSQEAEKELRDFKKLSVEVHTV